MIAVSDTSPIRYLVAIDLIDMLPKLYVSVLIPRAVYDELAHPKALSKVRNWLQTAPEWLVVCDIRSNLLPQLSHLDLGEQQAILLAMEQTTPALLLIDELKGRVIAKTLHSPVTGILGVLETAADQGLLDLRLALQGLIQTNFRVTRELLEELHARHRDKLPPPVK